MLLYVVTYWKCIISPEKISVSQYQIQVLVILTKPKTTLRAMCHIPSPGIYAVTTFPLLNLTLAIFLSPELGFLGFVVPTLMQTPFISGRLINAGDRLFRSFCMCLHPLAT